MKIVEVAHEGVEIRVELNPCRRCKKLPTAKDAQKALKHSIRTASRCAVCDGLPPFAPQHALFHSVDVDCGGNVRSEGFILCKSDGHDGDYSGWISVSTYGAGGRVEGGFHIACLKRVAPGIVVHPPVTR